MDLQKSKLVVIIPIVVSVLAATFGSVKYIINLTETIEENKTQVILLKERCFLLMLELLKERPIIEL